jgi:NAD(P)-dependent dehydrogenase (short-subunit alcohol dehydrogenase family)
MNTQLKKLSDQVIVVTGGSSGIGLTTARMAARAGAAVVIAARNEHALSDACAQIRRDGGCAEYVVADVSDIRAVERIAETAVQHFAGIDTWVNNAAVSMYGRLMELTVEDMRRQFETNFWGTVYGSRVAVQHLRDRGGAIINVASGLADRAIPLQGIYCAAKHAMKAFTDTLRMELEAEAAPISVTLVKPASIDTPFFEKAKTYLDVEPQPIPPVYAPETVARAILYCAEHPLRDVFVGGMAKAMSLLGNVAPRTMDRYMERTTFTSQQSSRPVQPGRSDNLYTPVEDDGGPRGRYEGRVMETSLYTDVTLHRPMVALRIVGVGLALAGMAVRALESRRATVNV